MIHEPAKERILSTVEYDPITMMSIFDDLAEKAEENKPEVAQYTAMFVDAEDEFVEGTYVPEIWFVLRKVVSEEEDPNVDQISE